MPPDAHVESKPSSARYSVRALLIVVALACFAVGAYAVWSRLTGAERELRRLRNEAGVLTIDDRSQVHIIALDEDEPETWRWRLFVPKGHRYSWNIAAEGIPQTKPPLRAGATGISNEPYSERDNEVMVTAKLRQVDGGDWQLSVDSRIGDSRDQMYGATLTIPQAKMQWMSETSSTDGQLRGNRGMEVLDPHGPIILLQRRPCERQPDGSYQPSPNPMPGFMIWLKEE